VEGAELCPLRRRGSNLRHEEGIMAELRLRSLLCEEPATSNGDDIEIFVGGISAGGQFPIDQGQFRDLSMFNFPFAGQIEIRLTEDTDPAGAPLVVQEGEGGVQSLPVRVKADGRYQIYFEVVPSVRHLSNHILLFRSLHCVEPATSFGDDVEIFANGLSLGGPFPIDKGQFRDLSAYGIDFDGQVHLEFEEDSDPAGGAFAIPDTLAGQGVQKQDVKVKEDGRYSLFYEVIARDRISGRLPANRLRPARAAVAK